jgi:hypothetical protein
MKRCIFFLLPIILVFNTQTLSAKTYYNSGINPFFKDRVTPQAVPETIRPKSKAAPIQCTSYSDLVTLFKANFEIYSPTMDVHLVYNYTLSTMNNIIVHAMFDALDSDDYLLFCFYSYNYSYSGINGDATINLQFSYLTTLSQEQYVSTTTAQILGEIITSGMSGLDKEKAVHDWIIQHVQYDHSMTYYSAYDGLYRGTAVCKGYALLFYKMLHSLGMDVRIAYGMGSGALHA